MCLLGRSAGAGSPLAWMGIENETVSFIRSAPSNANVGSMSLINRGLQGSGWSRARPGLPSTVIESLSSVFSLDP